MCPVNRFVVKTYRAGQRKDQKYPDQYAPIANAIHHKGFFCRTACFVFLDVIADQQIGTQPDAFPADEHQQKIICQNKRQHREHEKVQIREESVKTFIAMHVADGEDMYQQPYKCDKKRVYSAKAIHTEPKIRPELADLDPRPEVIENRLIYEQSAAIRKKRDIESDNA